MGEVRQVELHSFLVHWLKKKKRKTKNRDKTKLEGAAAPFASRTRMISKAELHLQLLYLKSLK